MRKSFENSASREIRALFVSGTQIGLSDGELLMRFINREGEASESAFAALVHRHGPMVFRVCRRLLTNTHDSQDAFQATFLILVRKAGSLKNRDSVGPWLFGVACRIAARSRTSSARRSRHERQYVDRLEAGGSSEDPNRTDLQVLLHEEIGRLPDRYRIPIVLCYLGGVNQEEAAAQLGWPIGTVRSRLARARERLRGRLIRRGVALSAGALSSLHSANASAAPLVLVNSTVKAAMGLAVGRASTAGVVSASVEALMKEALGSIFMTKLKTAVAILATLGATATGAGVFAFDPSPPRSENVALPAQAEPSPDEPQQKDEVRLKIRARRPDFEERLHKAIEKATREQLIKAILEVAPKEQLLRALEGENPEEREVKAKQRALDEHRTKEGASVERLHNATEKASRERLIKAILASGPEENLLRILDGERAEEREDKAREEPSEEREAKARQRALEEHRAKERASVERLHKAAEKASREQLIKAVREIGPKEPLLRILEGEDAEEREAEAKEKARKK